ncbi:MAG: large subunit ribosomal protein L19e [Patescibacteria group bacterium]|jgi:large subunit ribosomal protein L19e
MNLANKKDLASKVLKVGKGRIFFNQDNLGEIKEAITRRDIADLHKAGAIQIKEVSGRKTIVKRKNRRRVGKVKKKVNTRKQEYVIITRKLRTYLRHLLKIGTVDKETYRETRRQIRARKFRSKRNLKEAMESK